ncbi:30S ribosomal protein S13 [Candidatus Micrarchaeota archaeon]|nr:30S ribosomal protein S13 [Candidatus Micrarchaeota archaeon]
MAKAKKGGKQAASKKKKGTSKPKKKTEKKEKKDRQPKVKEIRKITTEEAKGIIRVCGKEVNGVHPICRALTDIEGIGEQYASAISYAIEKEMGVDPWTKPLGELDEADIERVEEIVNNPLKYNVPEWMINRRRDVETNQNKHLVGNELRYSIRSDIERERSSRSWVGFRHSYGKRKVRGQKTRSRGRRGGVVGVVKKKGDKGGKK